VSLYQVHHVRFSSEKNNILLFSQVLLSYIKTVFSISSFTRRIKWDQLNNYDTFSLNKGHNPIYN
jgi:hypothetical protein